MSLLVSCETLGGAGVVDGEQMMCQMFVDIERSRFLHVCIWSIPLFLFFLHTCMCTLLLPHSNPAFYPAFSAT